MYTYDQIATESLAIPCIDYYKGMELFKETVNNFILGKSKEKEFSIMTENSIMSFNIGSDNDKSVVSYMTVKDGVYNVESVEYPELRLESNNKINSIESNFLKSLLMEVD